MARSEKDRALLFSGSGVRDGRCPNGLLFCTPLFRGGRSGLSCKGFSGMKSKGLPCHFARQDADPFFMNRLF